ncbi:hypothetical protein HUN59_14735 [Curtobacterium sp. Csp2]|uniref:hypothetical protein n=1 Tax=Curtobacterium sp. Csp2 TaxID=2495430 RepID=UPI0015810688|nr:hypothetical protein [Curtobacterium sp. Csp2]QKS17297.1 hypothetical protein HUN59_14735 [Curtobacterium sp. Csp2]
MTVDTAELETYAKLLDAEAASSRALGIHEDYTKFYNDAASKLREASSEIVALRAALDAAPHGTLCGFMMSLHQEPCSCWKSVAPPPRRPLDLTQVNRLEVIGPEHRELVVRSSEQINVALHLQDDGHTLKITYRDVLTSE